jgi:hypothetical protein
MGTGQPTGRTMRVAHKLRAEGSGDMALAVELIDVHLPRGDQELSLVARRSLLLMLEAAAGDAWRYEFHRIAKRDLRGKHASMEHVRAAFADLMGVWFSHGDMLEGRKSTRRFHLLDEIHDQDDAAASAVVLFRFSKRACEMFERSDVYARLSREAIVRFRSTYALRAYEVGAALYSRRDPTWRGDVQALRKLLQVPEGTYLNFAQLRRRVLEPAKEEIDQLAEFDMTWRETTKGRQVIGVELRFASKGRRQALAAAEENQRHSAGRRARREGTTETIVEPVERLAGALSWPSDDVVSPYSGAELHAIGREHGGGWDVSRLATAYAAFMGDKRRDLTGDRLRKSWRGFCETKARDWGPPG